MSSHHHRVVIGYHGCDRSVARGVLLEGRELTLSQNRYDWLGEGAYFWEHGPERALSWAQQQKSRGKLEHPCVLGAYLSLGRCFDLMDLHATKQLRVFYDDLEEDLRRVGQALPVNKPLTEGDEDVRLRYLDCAVINSGLRAIERVNPRLAYQTVRGAFQEGDEAFPGAAIRQQTHLQIAVRDPECILGYFLPRGYTLDVEDAT